MLLSLMAVINAAQSSLSTAWHPVSQTSLTPTCKLTVPTYRVYCSDWPWIARPGIQISGKNQLIFTLYRVGDNKYHVGGSVVLKEPPKGYLTVKVYIDNRKLFKKRISPTDLTVQWELNPPM